MANFSFDSDELKKVANTLDEAETDMRAASLDFSSNLATVGQSVVVEALNSFSQAASNRRDGTATWCRDTGQAVLDTKNQAEATDQDWAASFTFDPNTYQ